MKNHGHYSFGTGGEHRKPLFRRHNTCAPSFSLVELLMVMSILAMLVGLITYGVSYSRNRAIMIRCQNNLREHGVVLQQFMLQTRTTGERFGQTSVKRDAGRDGLFWIRDGDDEARVTEDRLAAMGDIRGMQSRSGSRHSQATFPDYMDVDIPGDVRFCPAVDNDSLIDTNSPKFKGFTEYTRTYQTWGWDGESVEDTSMLVDRCLDHTSYALNTRDNSPGSVAYIDWNAAEGWGTIRGDGQFGWHGVIDRTTWMFDDPRGRFNQGDSKGTTNWWKTEVGFHHMGGANYITWGGSGGWVHSNDIDLSYFDVRVRQQD